MLLGFFLLWDSCASRYPPGLLCPFPSTMCRFDGAEPCCCCIGAGWCSGGDAAVAVPILLLTPRLGITQAAAPRAVAGAGWVAGI